MEMQSEIKVTTTPAVIDVNFDIVKAELISHLAEYKNTIVTDDTVKEAKALAADINKMKTAISTRRKEAIDAASVPINQFKEKMNELVRLCDDARACIVAQVSVFETERKDKARALLLDYRLEQWQFHGVTTDFQNAEIESLVSLGALTSKGALTKGARQGVEAAVQADKSLQDQTDRRLMQVKSSSLEAGINPPLSRDHVESFLFEREDVFTSRFDAMIESEKNRIALLRENIQESNKQEQSKQESTPAPASLDSTKTAEISEVNHKEEDPASTQFEPAKPNNQGLVGLNVVTTFKTDVPYNVSDDAVRKEITRLLAEAGITTLDTIDIYRYSLPDTGSKKAS